MAARCRAGRPTAGRSLSTSSCHIHERHPLLRPRRPGPGGRPARLRPRRPQRAAGRRRPHYRRHPHPRQRAVPAPGARRRRGGDGHLASRPADRGHARARRHAGAGRRTARRTARPRGAAGRRLDRGRRGRAGSAGDARELPRQQGREEERRGAVAQDGGAVRHLRQRRLRHRAPRRGVDARHRALSRRSPAPGRCWPPRSTPSRRRWRRRSGRWWRSSPAPR